MRRYNIIIKLKIESEVLVLKRFSSEIFGIATMNKEEVPNFEKSTFESPIYNETKLLKMSAVLFLGQGLNMKQPHYPKLQVKHYMTFAKITKQR